MTDSINPYQTPDSVPSIPDDGTYKPTWKQIFFSFEGRIKRSQWWAVFGLQILVGIPLELIMGPGDPGAEQDIGLLALVIIIPLYVLLVWTGLASSIKRWHDRNKSGWWILIGLIPVIGWIWAFVENGCLPGVDAGNRFGPKPE